MEVLVRRRRLQRLFKKGAIIQKRKVTVLEADKKHVLSIDLETYSDVDLGNCGVYRYVEGDFHILLFAYAFDDEDVRVVDMACGETLPKRVVDAIFDENVIKAAWNAQFERTCLSQYFGVRLSPDSWQCSMVWSASLSLPLKLKTAAEVLKTGEQKDDAGERLIKYFSVPCRPTKTNGGRTRNLPEHDMEGWQRFKSYCLQDVRTERDIRHKLEAFPLKDSEWDFYHMDQRINDRGIRIDRTLVEQAITCDLMLSEEMTKKAYELTGLENPNSVSQLKGWLEERGIEIDSLGKKDVTAMIKEIDKSGLDQEALDMLKLRLQMAKSSVKKYQAADRYVCKDGRAHGLFQFSGANRTQRWAGRGIQLQNLPQNHISTLQEARDLVKLGCFDMVESIYGNTPDILSQLIRTMLIPKEGSMFVVADFSAIEARVLAWLAGEEWVLDAFRKGQDLYCTVASQMFHKPVVKHGINGELRQKGKIATLACGYGGSSGALISMGALEQGLTESELPDIIESWRLANPKIVQFWWDVEKAAIDTVKDHRERTVRNVGFQFSANTLWIVLPSGRRLAYIKPRLQPNRFGRMAITYEGLNTANKWSRGETYSGKLVENITQSTARDLLAEAMWRMEKAGLAIVGHVHDEVILEVPTGSVTVEDVTRIMNENPSWAEGLPLSSAGYIGPDFYYKS
jgi:DNA polymerase